MTDETFWMVVFITQVAGVVLFVVWQVIDCWRNGI